MSAAIASLDAYAKLSSAVFQKFALQILGVSLGIRVWGLGFRA